MKTMVSRRGTGQNFAGNQCLKCKKSISSKKKFCSLHCYWEHKIGEKHNWGYKISAKLKGKKKSKDHIERVRIALMGKLRPEWSGQNHWNWKGGRRYDCLHEWVAKHKGRPKKCEMCGLKDKDRKYHWANISGEYKRELTDYIRLCVSCHKKMDLKKRATLTGT